MGDPDNWTTPKHIKIEREGEPRGTRRGKLKKGERRKGKKARLDEVLSARNTARRYFEWMEREKIRRQEHPEWYAPLPNGSHYARWEPKYQQWYEEALKKYLKLLDKCIEDGVITFDQSKDYLI